jgi:hypothetical protein
MQQTLDFFKTLPLHVHREKYKKSVTASWNPLLSNKPKKIRQQLFEPGGPLARVMAGYSTVLQVNDSVFAHGGVLPHHGEQHQARQGDQNRTCAGLGNSSATALVDAVQICTSLH